ncbi:hypothetical protein N752_30885 [Desulforamulus aquiferis]|nr:hypothetical protein N752_30885 [Desulforamulus aquiferis]
MIPPLIEPKLKGTPGETSPKKEPIEFVDYKY